MNFQLSPDALLTAIESDVRAGLIPLYVCLTLGTTSTTAVDPLLALSEIAKRFLMWVRVDAAYAGSACICPEFRHFLDGVKDQTDLTKALSNDPELLKNKASDTKNVVDYKDWQIALSRRFRAMKLWMVIRSYGVTGLQEVIRKHVKLAKHFEALLIADKRFEVVVPRKFATVCFKVLAPNASNEDSKRLTQTLLDSLNVSGLVYMTHAVIEGVYVIRVAIGATLTEEKHVRMLWDMVQEHATHLLASYADIQ
ncbi:putative carboxy-lyase [Helianthus annuus]|uniref:Carboxy-lyase n=1 Tax=Helianthus annuus TaxID=4232 RepID=A0A9K3JYL9_HELAN|nr:putative carboxy-lyase [Helianthus annuus]KAJ0613410.1 putative carboxy-lyase [Helianthus annuus]KAJ0625175.1 putative carboxy-lyase [Helianthus annuus]KAJ0628775.1 putative carboxy-lyase [Helianthus annuus]KAJ0785101.1 putative carboxy-lyase [Helianthus annuus]